MSTTQNVLNTFYGLGTSKENFYIDFDLEKNPKLYILPFWMSKYISNKQDIYIAFKYLLFKSMN